MKIKLLSTDAKMPRRADIGSAGFDLYTPKEVTICYGRQVIPIDIAMSIDFGWEGHIRPRSGFSLKGIEGKASARFDADVVQGTIDSTYRGNIGVIIKSHEKHPFTIPAGTRIAQIIFEQCFMGNLEQVEELDQTDRGEGGFGHTGTK